MQSNPTINCPFVSSDFEGKYAQYSQVPFHFRQLFTVKRRCGRELFLPFKDKRIDCKKRRRKKKIKRKEMKMKTEWMQILGGLIFFSKKAAVQKKINGFKYTLVIMRTTVCDEYFFMLNDYDSSSLTYILSCQL